MVRRLSATTLFPLLFVGRVLRCTREIHEQLEDQMRDMLLQPFLHRDDTPLHGLLDLRQPCGVLLGIRDEVLELGDLIAEIKIVPNVVNLNAAESRVAAAGINVKNREREHARHDSCTTLPGENGIFSIS